LTSTAEDGSHIPVLRPLLFRVCIGATIVIRFMKQRNEGLNPRELLPLPRCSELENGFEIVAGCELTRDFGRSPALEISACTSLTLLRSPGFNERARA
jgi:hypothetical protein